MDIFETKGIDPMLIVENRAPFDSGKEVVGTKKPGGAWVKRPAGLA